MCGLAGYIDTRGKSKADKDLLIKMAGKLTHRGPDSTGCFVDENVGFGFRRLSIIDLQTGDQPLFNEDNSIALVCNGEIFNHLELRAVLEQKGHVFRTNSDVEVLLHLYEEYGTGFLNKLNGQFAFALFDKNRNRLFLARDPFGIAPLYYTVADGLFIFASEIKAILEHPSAPRQVDLSGIDQIFAFPGLVSPTTLFKNICSLKSGHYIVVENSDVKIAEFWDLDYPREGEVSYGKPESYYVEKLEDLLSRSVKYRLQADVPVGFYLSGGLDSSIIAALIRKVSPETARHSFSIGFNDKEICEARYQQMVAQEVRSIHHEIIFDWADIEKRLRQMVYHCECPVKESYNTCMLALSESARQSGIKVVLTGQGADELFGGYISYRMDRVRDTLSRKDGPDKVREDELREKLWGDKDYFYENNYHALKKNIAGLYSERVRKALPEFDCYRADLIDKERLRGRHPVHQRSYLDFKLRLVDHLLSDHGDRMNLASSVEGRFPFLDTNLVEYITKELPPELKVNGHSEKYILKKMASGLIPREIIERDKYGFRAPSSPYLLRQNIDWINDLLSYARIKRQGYFDADRVEKLKTQYLQEGFSIHPHLRIDVLMMILTFGILLDQFKLPDYN